MARDGFDAIVIGAGANGLVAALTLAHAGRQVLVLERADGVARTLEFAPGFRTDPSAFDQGWVPPAVTRQIGRRLDLIHPAVPIALLSPEGRLPLARDPSHAADAIRRYSKADAARWPAFTARVGKIVSVLEALYQLPAPDIDTTSPAELWSLLGLGRRIRSLGRKDMTELFRTLPMSVHELLGDWFESGLLRATIGAGGIQDLRQGPRSGGTAFVLLHHLTGADPGTLRGRGYWREGPEAFRRALADRATGLGVSVRTQASVERITVRDDAVCGVVLDSGEAIDAPIVVSTADPKTTLLRMVSPEWLDPEFLLAVDNIRYRACAVFLLFAVDALPESLDGAASDGVFTLTEDLDVLERAADAAKYGAASERPHVECVIPSLRWAGLAPEGKHVILARAQYAPYALRNGGPWGGEEATTFADRVTEVMEEAMPGFSARVLHRVVLTPRDLEERYGWTQGAPTHGELGLDQILFMRPVPGWGRHRMPIDGLFLGGAGTHPGPGVAGGPGWLAAREVLA